MHQGIRVEKRLTVCGVDGGLEPQGKGGGRQSRGSRVSGFAFWVYLFAASSRVSQAYLN